MKIEEAIEILSDLVVSLQEQSSHKTFKEMIAIETLLTAYKKEKEKNKELEKTLKQTQNSWYEDTQKIEKQQKEIEKEKEKNGILRKELNKKIDALDRAMNNPDYICKDKIKAKIEELEKGDKNTFIRGEKILVLQSLLEEKE